jgi:hypothetical protein
MKVFAEDIVTSMDPRSTVVDRVEMLSRYLGLGLTVQAQRFGSGSMYSAHQTGSNTYSVSDASGIVEVYSDPFEACSLLMTMWNNSKQNGVV